MSECWCDYEPSQFYYKVVRKARKQHRCTECGKAIFKDETYEYVSGKWDYIDTFKTCRRCLKLREYVKAHVPCFCWAHTNMLEDAISTLQDYAHEAPGLLFGGYRLYIAIKSAKSS